VNNMNIETELVQAKQYLEQNRLGQAKLIYPNTVVKKFTYAPR